MKKYDLSEIMKRAWEIKKENKDNIFSFCLKMAWEEAKDPVIKAEEGLLKEYNVKLAKEVEGTKDMLFFMINGKTRVVENAKKVYAGKDLNGVNIFVIIDCKGAKYMVPADGIKKMGFCTKKMAA